MLLRTYPLQLLVETEMKYEFMVDETILMGVLQDTQTNQICS